MAAKLIIRVSPNDRIEVKVEGLTELDRSKPKGEKLCEKVTRRLEEDLGIVEQRVYEGESQEAIELIQDQGLKIGSG